jgi:hypothetical protein
MGFQGMRKSTLMPNANHSHEHRRRRALPVGVGHITVRHLRLHANATTTPRIRAYIQKSCASTAALARELGIHPWRGGKPDGRSIRPHRLASTITDWEEALILECAAASPWRSTILSKRCGAAPTRSCRARYSPRPQTTRLVRPLTPPSPPKPTPLPASSISTSKRYIGFSGAG